MEDKTILFCIITIFLIGFITASDFTPQGNINLRNIYNITNVPLYKGTNINITGNVTAVYFIGDGSLLTGVTSAEGSWNGNYSIFLTHITWSQATNGTLALMSNLSAYMLIANFNTTNSTYFWTGNFPFTHLTNFTNNLNIGKWTLDKINYVLLSDLNNGTYVITSILNNGSYFNTVTGNTTEEIQDAIGNAFGNGLVYNDAGNWFNHTDTSTVSNQTNVPNTFLQNITFDGFGHVLSIVAAAVDFSAYTTTANLVNVLGNWSADKTNYYTKTENDATNTSNNNFIAQNNQSVNVWANGKFYFNVSNFTGSRTDGKICIFNATNWLLECTYTDQTGAGGNFDLNITSQSGIGVISDSEEFGFTGAGSVTTSISGNNLTITGTDTFNTTEEMQDAAGAAMDGNFTYNDAGNYITPDSDLTTYLRITLDTIYRLAANLIGTNDISDFAITSVKIAFGSVNASHISPSSINNTHILGGTIDGSKTSAGFNSTYDVRYLNDLVDDTTPQLGGYLDANGQNIGSTSDEIWNTYVATGNCTYYGNGQEARICYNGTSLIIG